MSSATTTYSMILGSLLAKRWEGLGMKQQDFFTKSGIATGTWSRIMRGQAHFQVEDLRAACSALEYSVSELTTQADNLEAKLVQTEDVLVATKEKLKSEGSVLPGIIAGAALGFLVSRLIK